MTQITPEALPAELHKAASTVFRLLSKMDESSVAEPSELPGWTRGHVLAHIAGISKAMARQLDYARRGETIELYDGGMDGRNKAIELAAGHSLARHTEAVTSAVDAAVAAFDALGPNEWQARIAYRDGTVLDGGLALWRELTIHASDLKLGFGPETWSRPFCEHLIGFLEARVPDSSKFVLQPTGLPQRSIGSGGTSIAITGMLTDIAAWLAGREPSLGSLRATAAADGVDLPELLPWPAALPAPR
ncbi:maleylpyruvate isomerase family mycothiol-dependent enzyme [Paenarthrobacter aurescens]|uniref:Maleylpyruvate isomerase n=1 Tax=Paenarthrobacter aurescens TaxID=43663 RepID=A0A4Y3NCK5_PAEAU|nr:maleylpyruvate isomerase family mycothiol-dependent enzyme [Paenarthrobacter aurescens]MDO6143163.1 maleylpyruvate isomerase family mycothiol-dependent enzyme [Paenarthrobacter aurescens]MDO6147009.1 maleylpyruvate isomerase family mycothiol-dependent enzyme [Paenarthrobacter aurescens]MDO6158255.1 maleylpyruvate isomerase family mycothiol-dependent enzyme [Paenarthrobacter aurescens]MDO6162239.1 maleylpyruvate isomerase family mycothiol-dependent enzyme [Paenarthrobacter aurescens]GEB19674